MLAIAQVSLSLSLSELHTYTDTSHTHTHTHTHTHLTHTHTLTPSQNISPEEKTVMKPKDNDASSTFAVFLSLCNFCFQSEISLFFTD